MAGGEELLSARSVVEVAPTLPTVVPGPLSVTVSWTLMLPPRLRMAQLLGPAAPSVDWMISADAGDESPSTPAENKGAANISAERETTLKVLLQFRRFIRFSRTLALSRGNSTR